MRFVYATRPLPQLEFATTCEREAVPEEAAVFAVCDGALTIRHRDETTFSTLTDQEQTALEALIAESQSSEMAKAETTNDEGLIRSLLRRLLNF